MKVGDMVVINTGHTGIIVGIEYLYPGHPQSPARNYEIMWNADDQPHHAFRVSDNISTVNAFTIRRVVSRAER